VVLARQRLACGPVGLDLVMAVLAPDD
jgi:hypothetical protein